MLAAATPTRLGLTWLHGHPKMRLELAPDEATLLQQAAWDTVSQGQ